ncbi:response regulator transcription factor [Cohnella sp. JJ-181]|uniref:response regulator transcription factor n=1 Tax=Cohnella rhizoplanae TaxID=2974897 RepID=UPI0022FF8E5C|nr:response regulator transcription factor [Cohnella sp. JJ-181]CAI6039370.1 Transcriptional regulatory protein WalR [Cohnella sp. JJ-181]
MREKVMVIEDERKIAEAIAYALRREGYEVEVVHDGGEALARLSLFAPDAMILDVMLPGLDGYDILKKLQSKGRIGVIMLTAKEDIVNKVLGLELGADDYMTKPFDMRELLARLKSLLRRMQAAGEKEEPVQIELGGVALHIGKRRATAGGRQMDLTPKEFDLLAQLAARPGQVFTREQLLDLVWGMDFAGGTRTVDIHVQRLRKKLGAAFSELIQTVHGIGYKAAGGGGFENQH